MRRSFFETGFETVKDMKKLLFLLLLFSIFLFLSACETAVVKSARESAAPVESESGKLKDIGPGAGALLQEELGAIQEPFGLIKGEKYYNIHLGFVFNLPESWSYADSSEFEKALAETAGNQNPEDKDENSSCEMIALSDDGVRYIVFFIEDMRENDKASFVSEKIYQNQILRDLTGFNSAYKKLSTGSFSLGAYKYKALYMKAPEDGLFESYFSLRYGNYMVNIICRDKVEKAGQTLLENFEELE